MAALTPYRDFDSDLIRKILEELANIKNDLDEIKTQFDAHTHNADGGQAGSYFTSPPRTDAATVTAGTVRTITISSVGINPR